MNKKLVPESFIDELEVLAATGKRCSITFRKEDGGAVSIQSTISKIYEDEGQWYLLTGSAIRISLQSVEEVDGLKPEHFC